MTERQRRPNNQAILSAVEDLAAAYHAFAQALLAREDAERGERRYLRERLDAIAGHLERLQTQMDRRFDQVWQEVDALKVRIEKIEAGHGATD